MLKKELEQLFWEKYKLSVSKTDNYSAKDIEELRQLLQKKNLMDDAIDIPYYKLNALVKDQKLTPEEIKNYLNKKDSWRLTPWKKE